MKLKKILIFFIIVILISPLSCFATDEVTQDNVKISSESAILIDSLTGTTLYEKNADKKMYPASTTKILTAILAIEKGNLQDQITVTKKEATSLPAGYSTAYLATGEQITVLQALEVLLIHSANEAGDVLADYVSGSVDEFVKLMNEKATELGCTHFVNTNGIHDDNHYTTAKDLATIAKYCMKNETFRQIVSMKSCTIPKTNKSAKRTYTNTNGLLNKDSKFYLKDCIGIKTGFTSQAKNCLVSACNKNGLELIAVVLGSPTPKNSTTSTRYDDSINLYNYGYSNYTTKKVASKDDIIYSIDIYNANKETKNLDLKLANDVTALTKVNSNITYTINLTENTKAPIAENDVIGTITYQADGIKVTENLLATHDVIEKNYFILFLGIILTLILILTLLLTLIIIRRRHR